MQIERKDLDDAVANGVLSGAQADALWDALTRGAPPGTGSLPGGAAPSAAGARPSLREIVMASSAVALWFGAVAASSAMLADVPGHGWALTAGLMGVALLGAGFALHGRARRRAQTLMHVLGLTSTVGAAVISSSSGLASQGLVLVMGIVLALLGILLLRRSFAIAGALAIASVAGQLGDDLLADAAFPVVLAGIALVFAAAAVAWRRVLMPLGDSLFASMPAALRRALEPARQP